MTIPSIARVALRRQAMAMAALARPTPAYARPISLWSLFTGKTAKKDEPTKPQQVETPAQATETQTQTTETNPIERPSAMDPWAKAELFKVQTQANETQTLAAKKQETEIPTDDARTDETQATETQPAGPQATEAQATETPAIEPQAPETQETKEQPAEAPSAQEEPAQTESTTEPAELPPKTKQGPYKSRYGPRWIQELTDRINALMERKRRRPDDFSRELWKEIVRLHNAVNQTWSRIYAEREGFLTALGDTRGLLRHEVAWGDMVSHVNNVMYNKYAESARVNWVRGLATHSKNSPKEEQGYLDLMTPKSTGLILRSIKTDYKFPMKYPDKVSVFHKLVKAPDFDSDHVFLEAIILSEHHRRVAARCYEDIVVYDYNRAQKTTLKSSHVRDLRRIATRQGLRPVTADKEIDRLFKDVARMEKMLADQLPKTEDKPSTIDEKPSTSADKSSATPSAQVPLEAFAARRVDKKFVSTEDFVERAIDEALRGSGGFEADRDSEAVEVENGDSALESSEANTESVKDSESDTESPANTESSANTEPSKDLSQTSEGSTESKESPKV